MGQAYPAQVVDLALADLHYLRKEGLSAATLPNCVGLMKMLPPKLVSLSDRPRGNVSILARILREIIRGSTDCDVHAAGEFIGIRDEQFSDPTWTDRQYKLTPLNMRLARGGLRLKRPLVSIKRIREHVPRCIDALLGELGAKLLDNIELTHISDSITRRLAPDPIRTGPTLPVVARPNGIDQIREESLISRVHISHEYIHRPELEVKLASLIDENCKTIVLTGLPGMGKACLVEATLQSIASNESEVCEIRMEAGEIHFRDLQAAIVTRGIELPAMVMLDPLERLTLLVKSQQAPRFVVLYDIESTDELHRLLPRTARSTIIATCRRIGSHHPEWWRVIEVPRLSSAEARAMIQGLLPSLSEREVSCLDACLQGYPLVIWYAAHLIDQNNVPVQEFCADLVSDGAEIIGCIPIGVDENLTLIISQIIEYLEVRDPLTLDILRLASFGGAIGLPLALLAHYDWRGADKLPSKTRIAQAINTLMDSSIISINSRGHLASHPLTRKILVAQFADEIPEVLLSCGTALASWGTTISTRCQEDALGILEAIKDAFVSYLFVLEVVITGINYFKSMPQLNHLAAEMESWAVESFKEFIDFWLLCLRPITNTPPC